MFNIPPSSYSRAATPPPLPKRRRRPAPPVPSRAIRRAPPPLPPRKKERDVVIVIEGIHKDNGALLNDVFECIDNKIPCIVSRSLLGDSIVQQIYSNTIPKEIAEKAEFQKELEELKETEKKWEVFSSKRKHFVLLAPKGSNLHPKKESKPFKAAFKKKYRSNRPMDALSLVPKDENLTVCVIGHGGRDSKTLGMDLPDAKKFLTKLQDKRLVKKLALNSCYAGRVVRDSLQSHLKVPTFVASLGSFEVTRQDYTETESGEIYGKDIAPLVETMKDISINDPRSKIRATFQTKLKSKSVRLTNQWQYLHKGKMSSLSSSLRLKPKSGEKRIQQESSPIQTDLIELSTNEVKTPLHLKAPFPALLSMNGDGAKHVIKEVHLHDGSINEFFDATQKLYKEDEGDLGSIVIKRLESEKEVLENVQISISPGEVKVNYAKRSSKKESE